MKLTSIRSKPIMGHTDRPFQNEETGDLIEQFISELAERWIPKIQVVDGQSFTRVAYPKFNFVEWGEVGLETPGARKQVKRKGQA